MTEKIKEHFKNLNNIQKILYFIIVTIVIVGRPIFIELGFYTYDSWGEQYTGFQRIGFILVCLIGVFIFSDKTEKKENN